MRTLEVRRHTMRVKPGQHLSQAGVDLARRIGNTVGPFQRVVTTSIPRAFETAIAMGCAVDEQVEDRGVIMLNDDIEMEVEWDAGFAALAAAAPHSESGGGVDFWSGAHPDAMDRDGGAARDALPHLRRYP